MRWGWVLIKVNHRDVLDGGFEVAGVEGRMVRGVGSAVGKLDKQPWGEVRSELVEEKGVPEKVVERIGRYVAMNGELRGMLELLRRDGALAGNEKVQAGLKNMGILAGYLEALGVIDKVSFDLSLAQGLDYYAGVIFEVVAKPDPTGKEKSDSLI